MKFEEVQKAEVEFKEAKLKFDSIQNSYLVSRGYEAVIDYERGSVAWKYLKSGSTYPRSEAIDWAVYRENNDKQIAEKQVEDLKAKHGLDNVFIGCGQCVEAKS